MFFVPLPGPPELVTALQILWAAIIMDGPPAVSQAMDSARPGIMAQPPRHRDEPVLPLSRVLRGAAYSVTRLASTLAALSHSMRTGTEARALKIAFTTFVLLQFLNVFKARSEIESALNARFVDNLMRWLSLLGTLTLHAVAVH